MERGARDRRRGRARGRRPGRVGCLDRSVAAVDHHHHGGVIDQIAERIATFITAPAKGEHLVAAIQALTLGQTPAIPDTTDAMVDWLLAHEDRMPYREQAGDLTAGLHTLIQRAAKLCDRPDEKRYHLGTCRVCEQAMRTSRAMGLHRCCGEVYDIKQAYAETLARLHDPDNNLTQAEAATLLGVTVNAIKQRVKHRGVQPVVVGRRGVWYRLGDLA